MDAMSRQEVRAVDRWALEVLGLPGLVLMENAGRQGADAVEHALKVVEGRRAAVVAGGGNNGGDGFVVARHLALRGYQVATFLAAPLDKIAGDARVNLQALWALDQDVRVLKGADLETLAAELKAFDVVVDALGGTGIAGALHGPIASAVEQVNASRRPVVAVDIPTGLDCDTGQAPGPAVKAALTVTFVARKKGFDTPGAAAYTGRVVVADIGVPAEAAMAFVREKK